MLTHVKSPMKFAAVLVIAAGVSAAHAQRSDTYLAPEIGITYPTSGDTRDDLGSPWVSIGFRPSNRIIRHGNHFTWDLGLTSRRSKGNRVFIVRPSFGVIYGFGYDQSETQPYVSVRGGPAYFDYGITRGAKRTLGQKLGFNAVLEAGVVFNQRLTLSARYTTFSKPDGFDFSGIGFELEYQLFRF